MHVYIHTHIQINVKLSFKRMYFIGKDVMINFSIYGKKTIGGNLFAKHMVYIWNISKNRS